jgi:DNA polymerase III sliding clamp (beta) subunit (PCNA family)
MKVRKLDKKVLAVLNAASTDETRPVLQGVHIRENGIAEATNGILLLQAQLEMVDQIDLPSNLNGEVMEKEIIIPTDVAREAIKQAPKNAALPFMNGAFIVGGGIQSTDLDTTHRTEFKPIDGTYPNPDKVIPGYAHNAAHTFTLNPHWIEAILKAAKAVKADAIAFTLTPEEGKIPTSIIALAIKKKGEPIVTGCVMPMYPKTDEPEVKKPEGKAATDE